MCEDYRATATIDFAMDTADFDAGRRITTPTLLLWGANGSVGRHFAPLEIWRRYATDIRGAKALPCGHYVEQEVSDETAGELHAFFKSP
jgi:haloacetate dehalogenase